MPAYRYAEGHDAELADGDRCLRINRPKVWHYLNRAFSELIAALRYIS